MQGWGLNLGLCVRQASPISTELHPWPLQPPPQMNRVQGWCQGFECPMNEGLNSSVPDLMLWLPALLPQERFHLSLGYQQKN